MAFAVVSGPCSGACARVVLAVAATAKCIGANGTTTRRAAKTLAITVVSGLAQAVAVVMAAAAAVLVDATAVAAPARAVAKVDTAALKPFRLRTGRRM